MAAPNANGCFPSEADEYEFVLNNALLWDVVFNEFGYDPVLEFGNYRQVSTVMRTQILRWVRKQDFYWDEVLGLNEEEDIEEEEEEEVGVIKIRWSSNSTWWSSRIMWWISSIMWWSSNIMRWSSSQTCWRIG